jgi:choline-sulfatase
MATRRRFLQAAGGLASMASSRLAANVKHARRPSPGLPPQPNIIVLMTDQERYHTHWPAGWVDSNLNSYNKLRRHGLTFHRAYTSASECAPSRAAMLTGHFAPINRVARTLLWPGLPPATQCANIGALLRDAGYYVAWKGKWHLSFPENVKPGAGNKWNSGDIRNFQRVYGFADWNPPDAGNAIKPLQPSVFGVFDGVATLGGGDPDNDGRYVHGPTPGAIRQTAGVEGGESALHFISRARDLQRPFCLFVSLVNPHDIGFFPDGWKAGGYRREEFANLDIDLPPNFIDDLSTKPKIQADARAALDKAAPLSNTDTQRDYVRFYAHLHKVADRHINSILEALEEYGLTEKTIIIRLSDHGELGLSHGMREKSYCAYEEVIHIPLVISNPVLFPEPVETRAFYSHVDLLPTLVELAGISQRVTHGVGRSIAPVIRGAATGVQESILFSYDDVFGLPAGASSANLRALRKGDWTYAIYFGLDDGGVEYELYDLAIDPLQLNNLLHNSPPADIRSEWAALHEALTRKLVEAGNLPLDFPWPLAPAQ